MLCFFVYLFLIFLFVFILVIIIFFVFWEDGMVILVIVLMLLVLLVVCYVLLWKFVFMNRIILGKVFEGDVVIRMREGVFLLIKCIEEVVWELYFGMEECKYVVESDLYRLYMGLGMVLLMVSVVLLGNCGWNS